MVEELPTMNPHVVRTSAGETDGERVVFESTLHPTADAAGDAGLSHERWGIDFADAHFHPDQTERLEVVAGEIAVVLDGERQRLTPGETVTIPKGTRHRHWNPTTDPARVRWERSPAYRTAEWAESVYALAQRGLADEAGTPSWLHLAVLIDEFPRESAYLAGVPGTLQRVLAAGLAPLGRAMGYEATYSRSDVESG